MRWMASLAEMKPTLEIDQKTREFAMVAWRSEVFNLTLECPIVKICPEKADTESIINFTILNPETKQPMSVEEIEIIYKAMTMDLSDKFDWDQVIEVKK